LEFTADGEVEVRTYSPKLGEYDDRFDQQFTFTRNQVNDSPVIPDLELFPQAVGGNIVLNSPAIGTQAWLSVPQSADPGVSTYNVNVADRLLSVVRVYRSRMASCWPPSPKTVGTGFAAPLRSIETVLATGF